MIASRLAPSPTGALHLGNARTFLLNHYCVRREGGLLPLRIEDIDSPRKKAGAIEEALEDLRWLGLDHDGEILLQTRRLDEHRMALAELRRLDLVYPCSCSRRDVLAAASAPHTEDEVVYPGTCRDRWKGPQEAFAHAGRPVAWRFRVPEDARVSFHDRVHGQTRRDVARDGGDFVCGRWDPEGGDQPGYQIAVVVDDAWLEIDLVVRGDDLLASTGRQILVQDALGLPRIAEYAHLPLVVGPDGRRLAKRHGDTRLRSYREAGVPAARIRRWVERTASLPDRALDDPGSGSWTLADLPRSPVTVPAHEVEDGPPLPPRK